MRVEVRRHRTSELPAAALQASRQMWLAGLGAAVVSRDWIQTEAGNTFKSLVKEGTVVESRAIRYFGDQLETSMTKANKVWTNTRNTVQARVKQAADGAVSFVKQTLPRNLPGLEIAAPAKKATRATKRNAKLPAKRVTKKATVRKATGRRAAK